MLSVKDSEKKCDYSYEVSLPWKDEKHPDVFEAITQKYYAEDCRKPSRSC